MMLRFSKEIKVFFSKKTLIPFTPIFTLTFAYHCVMNTSITIFRSDDIKSQRIYLCYTCSKNHNFTFWKMIWIIFFQWSYLPLCKPSGGVKSLSQITINHDKKKIINIIKKCFFLKSTSIISWSDFNKDIIFFNISVGSKNLQNWSPLPHPTLYKKEQKSIRKGAFLL